MDAAVVGAVLAAAVVAVVRGLRATSPTGRPVAGLSALRWWTLPSSVPLLLVAVGSAPLVPVIRPAGLVTAVVVALGPVGQGLVGAASLPPLRRRPRWSSAVALALVGPVALVALGALIGPATAATFGVVACVLAPLGVDVAVLVVPSPPVLVEDARHVLQRGWRAASMGGLAGAEAHRVAVVWRPDGLDAVLLDATDVVLVGRTHRPAMQRVVAAGPTGRRVVLVDDPAGAAAWLAGEGFGEGWALAWDGDLPGHLP